MADDEAILPKETEAVEEEAAANAAKSEEGAVEREEEQEVEPEAEQDVEPTPPGETDEVAQPDLTEEMAESSEDHFRPQFQESQRRTFGSEAAEGDAAQAEDAPAVLQEATESAGRDEQASMTDMLGLENVLNEFRRCIESIGTQLDDEMNRQEMRTLRADIREKATRIENDLKERRKSKDSLEPKDRVHLQQVIKQLDTQLTTYHDLLERERAMTRQYPMGGSATTGEGPSMVDEAATPAQAQQMLRKDAKHREREQAELGELERDIVGLQGIQTEIATLIGEQEDDVQLIEQHVERAGDRVEHGHNQVSQGVEYSRSSRKVMCVVGSVVSVVAAGLIILTIIILAIVLANRN